MKTAMFAVVLELPILVIAMIYLSKYLEEQAPWPYYKPTLILLAFIGWFYRLIVLALPKKSKSSPKAP
jgi:hypothetical protein